MANKRKLAFDCACCGGYAPAYAQWWNRDEGYGCCPKCFRESVAEEGMDRAVECYGKPGIHHSINETVTDGFEREGSC